MNARKSPGSGPFCLALTLALGAASCSSPPDDGGDPPDVQDYRTVDVPYGAPVLVVMVNIQPGSMSTRAIAQPGTAVSGVYVESQDGARAYTDDSGTAVLSGIQSGYTTLTLEGGNDAGWIGVEVNPSGLTEVAISLNPDGAFVISQVDWRGGEVVTFEPGVSGGVPLTVIDRNDLVVVVPAGTYAGDLEIRGENVRVYGEGFYQSWPLLDGSVRVYGKNAQLRGLWVDGGLEVTGSRFTMTMAGIEGNATISGSRATFLDAVFCAGFKATGDDVLVARSVILPMQPICSPDGG